MNSQIHPYASFAAISIQKVLPMIAIVESQNIGDPYVLKINNNDMNY